MRDKFLESYEKDIDLFCRIVSQIAALAVCTLLFMFVFLALETAIPHNSPYLAPDSEAPLTGDPRQWIAAPAPPRTPPAVSERITSFQTPGRPIPGQDPSPREVFNYEK